MALKPGNLFSITPKPEIVAEPKQVIEDTVAVVIKSETDGWISIYQPDHHTDRFVLINPKGEKFSCKFYNKNDDAFAGASLLAMYNLNEHFNRNVIMEQKEAFVPYNDK